jgi:hypothetical protein
VEIEDLKQVAPMALRLRKSSFMSDYLSQQEKEQAQLKAIMEQT